jgi:hypothetical protein
MDRIDLWNFIPIAFAGYSFCTTADLPLNLHPAMAKVSVGLYAVWRGVSNGRSAELVRVAAQAVGNERGNYLRQQVVT